MDLLPSSPPHWHIVLNHFPSVGTVIALALLLAAFYWKSEDLKRASLALFLILSLLLIPTFITGHAAALQIQGNPGVSAAAIAAHRDLGLLAFCFAGLTGAFAWFALWQYRRYAQPAAWVMTGVLAFAIIGLFFMTLAGSAGGHINHPEIWPAGAAEVQPGPGPTAALQGLVHNRLWMWPALEVVHFAGMALLFGTVLFVCLRVLGLASNISYAALHRILPLGVLGFAMNTATGMMFYISETALFVGRPVGMYPKIALIVIGGVAIIYFTVFDKVWNLKSGESAAFSAKTMAAVTLLSWTGVLLFGRLLPYLEGL
jgi:hypothetical protein